MENLPARNARPSWQEGRALKPASQPKYQHRKAKSKQAHWSTNAPVAAPVLDELSGMDDSREQTGLGARVVSALQEFLQDSKAFRVPSRHSILQWRFEECCVNALTKYFRATAAFVLEGVPHHVAGEWQTSKNLAKRDSAERALGLFVGQWGEQLLQEDQKSDLVHDSGSMLQDGVHNDQAIKAGDVDTLEDFCRRFPPCSRNLPQLSTAWEGNSCTGLAEITLFEVPHTFAGAPCKDEDMARSDVARRVLWYLQCSGFKNTFYVDMNALASCPHEIAAPPSHWTVDGGV